MSWTLVLGFSLGVVATYSLVHLTDHLERARKDMELQTRAVLQSLNEVRAILRAIQRSVEHRLGTPPFDVNDLLGDISERPRPSNPPAAGE